MQKIGSNYVNVYCDQNNFTDGICSHILHTSMKAMCREKIIAIISELP